MNSIISSLAVILFFTVIGWLLLRNVKAPQKWWAWVLIILGTFFVSYVGTSTIVVGFPGFEMHLNDCLQGLAFGAIASFIIQKVKLHNLAGMSV